MILLYPCQSYVERFQKFQWKSRFQERAQTKRFAKKYSRKVAKESAIKGQLACIVRVYIFVIL